MKKYIKPEIKEKALFTECVMAATSSKEYGDEISDPDQIASKEFSIWEFMEEDE